MTVITSIVESAGSVSAFTTETAVIDGSEPSTASRIFMASLLAPRSCACGGRISRATRPAAG